LSILVLSAVRTPLGAFGGALRNLDAVTLGSLSIRQALSQHADVDIAEAYLGCAYPAGLGPHPARQAIQAAGLSCPAWTLNQAEGAGFAAVVLACRALQSPTPRFALAGSFESPSNVPYLLPTARWGHRMGETELLDGLIQDGPRLAQPAEPRADGARMALPPGAFAVDIPDQKGTQHLDGDEVDNRDGNDGYADGAAILLLASEAALASVPGPILGRICGWSTEPPDAALSALKERSGSHPIHVWEPDAGAPAGGGPLLVDRLHTLAEMDQRFGFTAIATGDDTWISLLLEH